MPYYNSGHSPAYNKDGGSSGPSSTSGGRGSSTEPTYMMEHLATFTVTKETGIVYPADGMRRLLQLEKSNGIWSQKMQLRLERNWVLIMDNETGAVMERFPAALIQEPTAFTSRDPMEMYNNILVFTVADDSGSGQRAEMHIFQCQSVSAQDLVEDLKMLQMGKLVTSGSPRGPRGHIPPPPALPPPEPPLNGVREQVSAFNAANDDTSAHNGISSSNRSSASSIESLSQSNGKLHTQESIVEVHSPPRNIILDPIPDKPALPPPPPPSVTLPASASPPSPKTPPALLASKSESPILPTSKSTPALPVLKSSPLATKSEPSSPVLALTSFMSPPPPPPPPPPPTPVTSAAPSPSAKTLTTFVNKTETAKPIKLFNGNSKEEEVQKELKFVLTMFREKKANALPSSLVNDMHEEVWLNQHSSPRDVQAWLAAKGFSEKVCKQFENMNGTELFNTSRRRLEQLCGLSEGSRLNGQLTLAKNVCEYKTARSSELKQILEKARRRAEELNEKDEVRH